MKVFFLIPYPLHHSPSQRFRFEQYFDILRQAGITYHTQSFWDIQSWKILYKRGHQSAKVLGFMRGFLRRLFVLFKLVNVDFVFIHRECMPVGPPILEWFIARVLHKKIIYDFDDAIWLPNTSAENKLAAFIKWHSKTNAICRWSYTVSCGNDFLADHARNFNAKVVTLPTTIDTQLHNPLLRNKSQSSDKPIVIGWTGSHSTLKYLYNLVPVLQRIENKYADRILFLIIADKDPLINLKQLEFLPWKKETEIKDLSQFDIGIMPLPDDIWTKGKCGFKALQYMALEIPAVVSPVGVNLKIIQDNVNGFLAATEEEWVTKLSQLIEQPDLRDRLGKSGCHTVVNHYSVKSQQQKYLDLFKID